MPVIKKVSALRNYHEVLSDVKLGQPVFLTKNGTGRFALIDIEEFNSLIESSWHNLFKTMLRSKERGESEGWLDQATFDKHMNELSA